MKNQRVKSILLGAAVLVGLTLSSCQEEQEFDPRRPGLLVPRTVDQDVSIPQISINGTSFHAETFGDAHDPMIVVLHGGPGGDYRSMLRCKAFANHGYFVVFYDQRGSGLSRRHPKNSFTMDVMMEDLSSIIRHFRNIPDQKIFLLGQSWGAMLATAFIDRYPGNISGAILAEPGGFTWKDAKKYITRTRERKPFSENVNDVFYFDQILTGKEDEHEVRDYKFALTTAHDNAKGNVIGNAGPTPFWRYGATAQSALFEIAEKDDFDFTRNLHQFTTQVLFVYSERNTAYGKTHAQHVSSAYPNVQLTEIPNTGHEITYFGWDDFFPVALAYLDVNR